MVLKRKKTKEVNIGGVKIGGDNPIRVQSMCTTDTRDVEATVAQILQLENAGCEIVRVAVPDEKAARALPAIKEKIHIPLVADIHFHYRLAILACENGADKIRINPGNIGGEDRVRAVVDAVKMHQLPVRIGVNSGSLEKRLIEKYGGITPEGMVESALEKIHTLESMGLEDLVLSLKASDVPRAIEAYSLMSEKTDYPLHLGITESGPPATGIIKSSVGIGYLLAQGIGDTIRISLTTDPVEEVRVGFEILKSLNLRERGPILIACPSCGRVEVDLIGLTQQVEEALKTMEKPVRVAVMGCVVNGPGEAQEADFAIVGGKDKGLIMKDGKILRTLPEDQLIPALLDEIKKSHESNSQ
ncbi:flavodoxin-dependent (E)-4-hydroxy-3-methylbut-2-enyl-diphosphate synthase [candidate division TA06 bacterium]|nr:flavodoxin-dependent (E)-4-hydroxy-3-methylbut-2-enyl-diphosphate synthase [candidate division TA06 bacterium]